MYNGFGYLKSFANLKVDDVSSGLYTYTLVIDGSTIDTKKMIIE